MEDKHPSQRGWFSHALYEQMKEDDRIWLLVGDLGYKIFDKHFKDFPDRCVNCGASETAMVDIAVGLALEGKIPFVYSISPFLIYRPFESLKLYLDGEQVPVLLVGSGRDKDYEHDGVSHDGTDIPKVMQTLPKIKEYYPIEKEQIPSIVKEMIDGNQPSFLSLKR